MTWQDLLLALGTMFFVVSSAVAIARKQSPPFSSCILTVVASLSFATAQMSLGLYFAAAVNTIASIEWIFLAVISTKTKVIEVVND